MPRRNARQRNMRGRRVVILLTSALPLLAENEPFMKGDISKAVEAYTTTAITVLPNNKRPRRKRRRLSTLPTNMSEGLSSALIVASSLGTSVTRTTASPFLENNNNSTQVFFPFEDTYGKVRRFTHPRVKLRKRSLFSTNTSLSKINTVWKSNDEEADNNMTTIQCNSLEHIFLENTTAFHHNASSMIPLNHYDDSESLLLSWNVSWESPPVNYTTAETILSDSPPLLPEVEDSQEATAPIDVNDTSTDESTAITEPSTIPPEEASAVLTDSVNDRVDYASKSLGALILDASPAFQGASNLLQKDNDKYAIIPCSEPSPYVIIGLSEDILVKRLVLANYERYSSHMKDIRVSASSVAGTWIQVGVFTNVGRQHSFDHVPPTWARYLKLEFLSHYGDEHYCTVTQISVYGSTMLQGFHEQWHEDDSVKEIAIPDVVTTDPVEVEFFPHWKGTELAPTCPAIPFIDGWRDYEDAATTTIWEEKVSEPEQLEALLDVDLAEEPVTESSEELEATQMVLAKLLHKYPNAKCLEQLSFSAAKTASHPPNFSSSSLMEPIFKKLSAEIKSIQSSLSAHESASRKLAACYQTILLDLLLEMETMRLEQQARIEKLETDMALFSWWARMWKSVCVGQAKWTIVAILAMIMASCGCWSWLARRPKKKTKRKKHRKHQETAPSKKLLADMTNKTLKNQL